MQLSWRSYKTMSVHHYHDYTTILSVLTIVCHFSRFEHLLMDNLKANDIALPTAIYTPVSSCLYHARQHVILLKSTLDLKYQRFFGNIIALIQCPFNLSLFLLSRNLEKLLSFSTHSYFLEAHSYVEIQSFLGVILDICSFRS